MLAGGSLGVIFFDRGQVLPGGAVALEAGRAEEHDGILDLLAAKARQRLLVFGKDAQNAPIRAVEEWLVLIRQRSRFESLRHFFRHVLTRLRETTPVLKIGTMLNA